MKPLPLTSQAHARLKQHICAGDILIDATAGNGHDTLFLAQQTGQTGRVFAFDPQTVALEATRNRLKKNAATQQCTLIQDGHEHLLAQLPNQFQGKVKAITFNLGYLPGAAKETTTQATTTLVALDQSLTLLSDQGIISLIIYKGHPAGKLEKTAIQEWLASQPQLHAEIVSSVDPDENSPELLFITDKASSS